MTIILIAGNRYDGQLSNSAWWSSNTKVGLDHHDEDGHDNEDDEDDDDSYDMNGSVVAM